MTGSGEQQKIEHRIGRIESVAAEREKRRRKRPLGVGVLEADKGFEVLDQEDSVVPQAAGSLDGQVEEGLGRQGNRLPPKVRWRMGNVDGLNDESAAARWGVRWRPVPQPALAVVAHRRAGP